VLQVPLRGQDVHLTLGAPGKTPKQKAECAFFSFAVWKSNRYHKIISKAIVSFDWMSYLTIQERGKGQFTNEYYNQIPR
jgi:hypothetical protein